MSQSPRLPASSLAAESYRAFKQVNDTLAESPLGSQLIDLVFLRVSQINGCAYCVDLHARDLVRKGEDLQRLNSLVTWQEVDFYSPRERAALAWAESLTHLPERGAPEALFQSLKAHFSDKEIADLTVVVAVMNAWNRLGVGMHLPVKRAELAKG
ncbi:MAG: carboxymuconolactone decarboxylase family protein [Rhodocyclaceae bacterium]